MKTPEHIEQAVAALTETIQEAARTTTTPESTSRQTKTIPQEILEKMREKRKTDAKCQNIELEKTKKKKTNLQRK